MLRKFFPLLACAAVLGTACADRLLEEELDLPIEEICRKGCELAVRCGTKMRTEPECRERCETAERWDLCGEIFEAYMSCLSSMTCEEYRYYDSPDRRLPYGCDAEWQALAECSEE